MNSIGEAIGTIFQLFEGVYAQKWAPNKHSSTAWALVLEGSDPDEVVQTSVAWCREGHEWPPTQAELMKALPSKSRGGESIRCKKRIAKQIMRGPTKRIYGSGGMYLPPPIGYQDNAMKSLPERQDHEPE